MTERVQTLLREMLSRNEVAHDDLISILFTATGDLSRNRRVGMELARGRSLGEILKDLGHVAEGVRSAKEVAALAKKQKVDMPVTEAVNAVLSGQLKPAAAVERLLSRDLKREG